jgi:hypothetical protein
MAMADEGKVFDAYVAMSVRGDVAPEVAKQQDKVDALNKKVASKATAAFKNRQAQDAYEIKAHQYLAKRREFYADQESTDQKQQEKEKEVAAARAKKDQTDKALQARQDLQQRKTNQLLAISQIAQATRGLPGSGAAASIAAGFVQGGPQGAAIAAGIQGAQYGIEGARKASPQDAAKLDYQLDRLQAIVGQHFVPLLQGFAFAAEKLGNFIGGSGAQLNVGKFSNFSQVRDSLQEQALKGLDTSTGASIGGLLGGYAGLMFGPVGVAAGAAGGARIGRSIQNALDG